MDEVLTSRETHRYEFLFIIQVVGTNEQRGVQPLPRLETVPICPKADSAVWTQGEQSV